MLGNRFGSVGEVGIEINMHICSAGDDGNGKAPCNQSKSLAPSLLAAVQEKAQPASLYSMIVCPPSKSAWLG